MQIVKRNGKKEPFRFDKIQGRLEKQTFNLNADFIDVHPLAIKIATGCYDGITSRELDNLAAETAASMAPKHPDYSILASRIAISALHKESEKYFSDTIENLYRYIEPKTGDKAGLISDEVYKIIMENKDQLNAAVINDRDFNFDYFGFKTLEKSYLLKINGKVVERPQHLLMRVSVGIWKENIAEAIKTYDLLSNKYMIHATPTLFNSGTVKPQMSSCFLLAMKDDSIKGIYDTLSDVADISQNAGGIGLHIHNVRATGSYIKGTNGTSNGLLPMLQVFNATARYVDQGGGKRKGSFAMYLEPWHADIIAFLDIRKNHGKEELRARDLFTAMWIPDLFMERIESDGDWSLMCPNECKGLADVVGADFKALYEKYEQEGKVKKTIKARELFAKIEESQIETGVPYMLYKDAANLKSNQQNLGTIKSSNLCLVGETKVRIQALFLNDLDFEFSLSLEELNTLWPNIKDKEVRVLSYNLETNESEWKLISACALTNPQAKIVKITDEETGKSIKCTPDHQVFTKNRGYVEAKNLKEDDILEIK